MQLDFQPLNLVSLNKARGTHEDPVLENGRRSQASSWDRCGWWGRWPGSTFEEGVEGASLRGRPALYALLEVSGQSGSSGAGTSSQYRCLGRQERLLFGTEICFFVT